ncbi:MAG TPA: cupin domain-containing protein [Anaerolineales bacterium]|nr:cupin domain-containing protein [Anaerolineales bacterium]
MPKVNLSEKFSQIPELWSPRIAAELNGQYLKLARLKGEFIWHQHQAEDELFLVVQGELKIQFRKSEEVLRAGEFLVVPRGVEHRPVAEEEVHVILLEPTSTVNTGEIRDERTRLDLKWI